MINHNVGDIVVFEYPSDSRGRINTYYRVKSIYKAYPRRFTDYQQNLNKEVDCYEYEWISGLFNSFAVNGAEINIKHRNEYRPGDDGPFYGKELRNATKLELALLKFQGLI